ncbi:GGDEF domain-containing protein [Natronospira bacteriovora]|uniref:diguanylate cyclase n=1 Tax=Natronospira bacteriovora TaxID=3069753 RepID=A0ABU0W9R1_9GAMM|nr:GGDEF domain-containing protein [Natronospira sp. AB-CW4]MDQ2070498.1 GGDEF domain-containing protein [Natronospira sp. AB-CW4]
MPGTPSSFVRSQRPLFAALLGWLPFIAVMLWLGTVPPPPLPALDVLALAVALSAILALTLIFLCLRLLPWAQSRRDPGLWFPQALAGGILIVLLALTQPEQARLLLLLSALPWLAVHAQALGPGRLGVVSLLLLALYLALPLGGAASMAPLAESVTVYQAVLFLLPVLALMLALPRASTSPSRVRGDETESKPPAQLLDQGALLAVMQREAVRHRRSQVPFSVCLLALDGLSRIHLERGEAMCERLNLAFGKCLLARARQLDVVGRRSATDEAIGDYSGLEFIAVLPETPLPGGVSFANRIRHAMEQLPIRVEGDTLRCTASVGIAEYRDGESLASLLLRAQDALHRAQRLGSNRVERETAGNR